MQHYSRFITIILLLSAIALAACGDPGTPQPPATAVPATAEAATQPADPATTPTEPEDTSSEAEQSDDSIRIARANWDTGWFQAEVYVQLLRELGYAVNSPEVMAPEDFYPALASGEFDFWPNGWFPLHNANLENETVQQQVTAIGSETRGGALQGYLIDRQTAEAEGITNLEQLRDPEIARIFDQDNDGKADLVGCNEGWGCEAVINHHLEAYELQDTVSHVQGNYNDLMEELLERFNAGEPVLFYTWTPNWPINELEPGTDVNWLEVPFASLPADMAAQEEITEVPNIAGCASNPCNLGYPLNDIRVVARRQFLDQEPTALRLFELVRIPLEDIAEQNATMFFGEDSATDIERQAENWIAENRNLVDDWLAEARDWHEVSTFERVRERGVLRCGVQENLPGFAAGQSGGEYEGFNADLCRAVATAVFGDADAVEFVPLTTSNRFAAVSDRRVDVLFHNVTWLAARDAGMDPPNSGIRLAFGPTIFHDGQRFMVEEQSSFQALEDLAGASICVLEGSPSLRNLQDQFAARNIEFELQRVATGDELYDIYERGGCDAVTADTSELVAQRVNFLSPDEHRILDAPISREPHSPVYTEDDTQWADIVNWAVFATIYAEELGVNSETIADLAGSSDPDVARLLGERGAIGQRLGLANDFAAQIIQQVGNYKEIYDRNLGPDTPLGLERGPNKTWNSPEGPGGLLSAPPLR